MEEEEEGRPEKEEKKMRERLLCRRRRVLTSFILGLDVAEPMKEELRSGRANDALHPIAPSSSSFFSPVR